jgi:uncharacterized membrane protein
MEPESEPGQPGESEGAAGKSSTGLDENIAGMLCYLLWFVSGIALLVIEKDSAFVRFHAMQSTLTFVSLFVLSFVVRIVPLLGDIASAIIWLLWIGVWVLAMLKAFAGERYKLPLVGDLTEQQLART